jgi:hypothetical protein
MPSAAGARPGADEERDLEATGSRAARDRLIPPALAPARGQEFHGVEFERYVDDVVVHCVSEAQAHLVLAALVERMREVGLELHPDKTRIDGFSTWLT